MVKIAGGRVRRRQISMMFVCTCRSVNRVWRGGVGPCILFIYFLLAECYSQIGALAPHASVVAWVAFNEAWGQHATAQVAKWALQRDPTRFLNAASGGNWFPVGHMVKCINATRKIKTREEE
jgi:hypothetical protein